MQNCDKKISLSLYREQVLELQAKIDERKMWLDCLASLGGSAKPEAQGEIWRLDRELNCQIIKMLEQRQAVQSAIDEICEPTLRAILERRYLLGETFEKIGEELGYSTRHIARLHEQMQKNVMACPLPFTLE